MAYYPSYYDEPAPPTIVTWSGGTDEEIAAMLKAHYRGKIDIHNYWTVGDERTITLSAMEATGVGESHAQQSVTLVLSNSGGKYLSDGITECAFQVDQKNCLSEKGYMNSSSTNVGGWKDSTRRVWCNSVYKNAIPSTLRDIFKEFINQSGTGGGNTSGVENTIDTFALRAEVEIFGSTTRSVSGEGLQVKWYETSSNRVKKILNTDDYWYERSPWANNDAIFCAVSDSGNASGDYAAKNNGLAPFGVI